MLLAMVWSTQGDKFTSIFEAINKIPLAFAPAITCVFVWGVFWPRGTKQASLATLASGFVLGSVDLALDIPLFGDTRLITEVVGPDVQLVDSAAASLAIRAAAAFS